MICGSLVSSRASSHRYAHRGDFGRAEPKIIGVSGLDHRALGAARLSPQVIEDRFEVERLFGDDDDHGFTPSWW